jgi:hypothetical protein
MISFRVFKDFFNLYVLRYTCTNLRSLYSYYSKINKKRKKERIKDELREGTWQALFYEHFCKTMYSTQCVNK